MSMPKDQLVSKLEDIQRVNSEEAEFIRGLIRTAKTEYNPDEFVKSNLFDETNLNNPSSTSFRNTIARYADENRRSTVCEQLDRLENRMFGMEVDKGKELEKKED